MATEVTNRPTVAGICRQIGQLNNPNDARVKNIALRQRLLTSDLERDATSECACKAFKAGRINGQQLFILGMSESTCRGIIGSFQSVPENIAEAAGKVLPDLDFLKELTQVNTWLRVAMVLGGGILIIIGLLMLAKQLGLRK